MDQVQLVTTPITFAPAPVGLAAAVTVDPSVWAGNPTASNLFREPAQGWLLVGVTNRP